MGTGTQYAQQGAISNLMSQVNDPNMHVAGGLQSVSSPSGNAQTPGLYTASMQGQGGGENMNRYFGNANTEACSMGFAGK